MSAGNSAYSSLPQSNSDSDGSSEEELHVSQGSRIVNRASKVISSKNERVYNEQKNIVINYKPLDNDGDGVALSEKFQPCPDEVSIVEPDGGLEIFSSSRKLCFVFSLLLCVFTTVAFIWILPCNVGSCINVSDKRSKNFTWEENISNLEIYGPISLVSDQNLSHNLVFLTKSFLSSEKNDSENGLRCLNGKDGSLIWKIKFAEEPTDIDCNLIDVNADGFNDCLVYNRHFLKALNSLTGNEFWDTQKANEKLYFGDFPVILPDLNKDEVKELLLPCSFVNGSKKSSLNYLVVISGKTGAIVNTPLQINSCPAIHNLMFEKNSILYYTCFTSNEKESFQNISLAEVYKTLKNTSQEKINFHEGKMLGQHKKDLDTVYVNGFKLSLKNQGKCPEVCDVIVDLKDEHESSNSKTVYSVKKKNTFGMAPVILKTEKETGFILKFWKWHSKTENSDFKDDAEFFTQKTIPLKNDTKSIKKRSKKLSHILNNSNILDKEMLLESKWNQQRMKRTAAGSLKNKLRRSVFSLHVITETIVKIVLNNSHFHLSNISEDEIIQMCTAQICQPNVYQQRHSGKNLNAVLPTFFIFTNVNPIILVLVSHLNEDRQAKLITFTSKYVHEKEKTSHTSETWRLQSKIRVLTL